MASIKWVEELLLRWGEYQAGGNSCRSGGYCSPVYNLQGRVDGNSNVVDLVRPEIIEVDKVMCDVKISHPNLFSFAIGWYVRGLSMRLIASRARCHIDTIYSRRDSLHGIVSSRMSGRLNVKG